jgi:hypothetical protein
MDAKPDGLAGEGATHEIAIRYGKEQNSTGVITVHLIANC